MNRLADLKPEMWEFEAGDGRVGLVIGDAERNVLLAAILPKPVDFAARRALKERFVTYAVERGWAREP